MIESDSDLVLLIWLLLDKTGQQELSNFHPNQAYLQAEWNPYIILCGSDDPTQGGRTVQWV